MLVKKKIKLYGDVGFVITENCSFECPHCMRGDRKSNTISEEVIDKFLGQVELKGEVYLLGGEPLMRSKLCSYLINKIYKEGNSPSMIHVITNGSVCVEKFEEFVSTLKANNANFRIVISNDFYHKAERERFNGGVDNIMEIFAGYMSALKRQGYTNVNNDGNYFYLEDYREFKNGYDVSAIGRGVNIPGAQPRYRRFEFSPFSLLDNYEYEGDIDVQTDGRVVPSEAASWKEIYYYFGPGYNIMKRSLRQILPRR